MGSIFKPKMPALPPVAPPPEPPPAAPEELSDEKKEEIKKEQDAIERRRRGRKSTILTGPWFTSYHITALRESKR